jgi:hypothetical protein
MFFAVGWHYVYWWDFVQMPPRERRACIPKAAALIGVEASVLGLPEFRNQAVILMRPARLKSRTTSSQEISFLRYFPTPEISYFWEH